MISPRTQELVDLHAKPASARARPAVARSRPATSPPPCAPTSQPFAPARLYACSTRHCGSWVELAPGDPLPADWITVTIQARKGSAARMGYRCGACRRRVLVFELLSDDLALGTVSRRAALTLARWCESQGLDDRGIRIVIKRLQDAHGAAAWAGVLASAAKVDHEQHQGQGGPTQ